MEITFYNVSIEKNIKIYDFIYKSRNFILYLNSSFIYNKPKDTTKIFFQF